MAKLVVHEVFRLPSRGQFVIAGRVLEGSIDPGMRALVWLDGQAFWSIPIRAVEFIDRIAIRESLVGLVCDETADGDAAASLDESIGDRQGVVEDGIVGEVAHGEVVDPGDGTGVANACRVNALDHDSPKKHDSTLIESCAGRET